MRVLLFASAREAAGCDELECDVTSGATVASAFAQLAATHPRLGELLPSCRAAIDDEFASLDAVIPDGSVLAVLPPVSGG